MSDPVRFSGVVWVPTHSIKPKLTLALGLGVLMPLTVVFLAFRGIQFPALLNPSTWEWPEYVGALVLGGLTLALLGYGTRRRTMAGIRKRMDSWCAQPERSSADLAAAALYVSIWTSKSARTASVAGFLAAVPSAQCRVVATGPAVFSPVDDGLLYEEADALEGRVSAIPRGLLAIVAIPFLLQISTVVMANGVNPLYWASSAWNRLIPIALTGLLLGLAYGLIRTPGKAAIVTPRRLQHASMGKAREFTTDDSVMYVSNVGPQVTVILYRNDGAYALLVYPSVSTPGFKQLINRWCMIAPGDSTPPASPPLALHVSQIQT